MVRINKFSKRKYLKMVRLCRYMKKISKKEFKEKFVNNVICSDCLEVMKKLPDECIDMVFIDPPYFLQLPKKKLIRWTGTEVNGVTEDWDKFENLKEYTRFTEDYLKEVRRLMKPKATIWVIGTYHNIFRIGKIMQDLDFWTLNNVIWFKTNPVPNFLGVRFTNATEELIWAVKDKKVKDYTFNKEWAGRFHQEDMIRTQNKFKYLIEKELEKTNSNQAKLIEKILGTIQKNNSKLGINVWQIPLCIGEERIKDKNGKKVHSTQKPEKLMKRIILTSTNEGDIILDPMAGTGTTGAVAKKYGRKFVMIEKDENYCKIIKERLSKIKDRQRWLEEHKTKIQKKS